MVYNGVKPSRYHNPAFFASNPYLPAYQLTSLYLARKSTETKMHPLKSFLRFSFLPRSLTRSNSSSPWKGKSTAPSLDITCPYSMDIDIPSPTPAPVHTQINLNPKADAIDDTPSLFCISEDADSNSDSDSDVAVNDSALDLHHVGWSGSVSAGSSGSGSGIGSSSRAKVVRVVSWASILSHRCRWTRRQERDLAIAERQLARCQKAWSSEQEVWLVYVRLPIYFTFFTLPLLSMLGVKK